MVKTINQNEFKEMDKSGVIVIDFNATWCGPCKMLAPVLEELSNDYEGKVTFLSADTDDNMELAKEYGITNIPALVLLKDGVKADMNVGFVPKEALAEFVDRNL